MTEEAWKTHLEAGEKAFNKRRVNEAELQFADAVRIAESFGANDSRLAVSLNNLAAVYHTQGKYGMAEPLYLRALDIRKAILGDDHTDLSSNMYNLGVLYSAKQDYEKAEGYYMQALSLRERALGPNHPDLHSIIRSFAELKRRMNRTDEAAALDARLSS
jgi:tetratricopeptide (TPR) repeat protein